MKRIVVNKKEYEINVNSVNHSKKTCAIPYGMYSTDDIQYLEENGYECYIDNANDRELVLKSEIDIIPYYDSSDDLSDVNMTIEAIEGIVKDKFVLIKMQGGCCDVLTNMDDDSMMETIMMAVESVAYNEKKGDSND